MGSRSRSQRAETAAHRRQRKVRTRARTLLRQVTEGYTPPFGAQVEQARLALLGHHSGSDLPERVLRIQQEAMASWDSGCQSSSGPWWCFYCKRHCKGTAEFCSTCARHWIQATREDDQSNSAWGQQQSPWRGGSPRRRQPRNALTGKGRGKGSQDTGSYMTSAWSCPEAPWKQGDRKTALCPVAAAPPEDAGQLQELVGAIRVAFGGQSLPGPLAEAVAKVENATDKKVTKDLHHKTAELGQARRRLHAIRKAKDTQTCSWMSFLQSTAEALDKGSKEYDAKMQELESQEQEARQKAGLARKAIRALASSSVPAVEVVEDSDSFSELEMSAPAAMDQDDTVAQAQKKLKTTLTELLAKVPDPPVRGADTPRRKAESKEAPPS